jgi:hypothetical protein
MSDAKRYKMKNVNIRIKIMEIIRGILRRVKKSSRGARTNERKTAREKGKSTGFASRRITPPINITIISSEAVTTLFPCIPILRLHYMRLPEETKGIFSPRSFLLDMDKSSPP